jgi:hypothetical protein
MGRGTRRKRKQAERAAEAEAPVTRKPVRRGGGGAMSALRGGFKGAVGGRTLDRILTVVAIIAAAVLAYRYAPVLWDLVR